MEQVDDENQPIYKTSEWRTLYPITTIERIGNRGELNWFNSSVQIRMRPLTKQMKCKAIMYSFDRRNWYKYEKPITVTQEGIKTLYYYGIDKLNRHECINKVEVKIDLRAPTTEIELLGTQDHDGYYTSAVEVTLSVEADLSLSGLKTTEYSLDGESWSLYLKPIYLHESGLTTLFYRSTNLALNTEQPKQKVIRIK